MEGSTTQTEFSPALRKNSKGKCTATETNIPGTVLVYFMLKDLDFFNLMFRKNITKRKKKCNTKLSHQNWTSMVPGPHFRN